MTILSGELFTTSHSDLKPNPKFDPILMFFYVVHDELDVPDNDQSVKKRTNHGIIYINNENDDIMRKAGICFTNDQNPVPVSDENMLMDKIIELVCE